MLIAIFGHPISISAALLHIHTIMKEFELRHICFGFLRICSVSDGDIEFI